MKAGIWAPEDIDIVILTHMHWDHCQNTDLFPNARVLLHPTEMDYARNPNQHDHAVATYMAEAIGKMKVELVSEGDRVVDGVSIIETPGHTKGHISILVESGEEKLLLAGDAMPDGGTVSRGLPYHIFWDVSDARESVEKMLHTSQVFYPPVTTAPSVWKSRASVTFMDRRILRFSTAPREEAPPL